MLQVSVALRGSCPSFSEAHTGQPQHWLSVTSIPIPSDIISTHLPILTQSGQPGKLWNDALSSLLAVPTCASPCGGSQQYLYTDLCSCLPLSLYHKLQEGRNYICFAEHRTLSVGPNAKWRHGVPGSKWLRVSRQKLQSTEPNAKSFWAQAQWNCSLMKLFMAGIVPGAKKGLSKCVLHEWMNEWSSLDAFPGYI